MDPILNEWLNLIVRWVHVIAGIMWIGSSIFFNFLENALIKPKDAAADLEGEVFMVHGGGYYHLVKKKLTPNGLPEPLHWFKWEAYTTWLSGMTLLAIVYYLGGRAFLVDPAVADISAGMAHVIGIAAIVFAWLFYDTLWRSPLAKNVPIASLMTGGLILGSAYGLSQVLSGRAAFIHVGAIIGSIMVGNVFFRIIPAQKIMVAQAQAGQPVDYSVGAGGKWRSRHNNYFTYPIIFIMISNHFPSTFGDQWNWVVLAILMIGSALIKHFLNISDTFKAWLPACAATAGVAALALFLVLHKPAPESQAATAASTEKVAFSQVQPVITQRCIQCHAAKPTDETFSVAPGGVQFDTPEQIKAYAERIKYRSVTSKTMPFANKSGMTEAERVLVGKWIDQGASLE